MKNYSQKLIQRDMEQQKWAQQARKNSKRKGTFCEKLDGRGKQFFVMFLDNSSIHGLNHFTKTERHILEIVLWIVMVGLALWGAVYLSSITWKRYQDSPTVVSMDRDMYAWNTTFPCVTVCPRNKLDEKKVETYIAKNNVKDPDIFTTFINELASWNYSTDKNLTEYKYVNATDYMKLILSLSINFNPALTIGTSGVTLFLEPTITELGLCYAVNSKIAVYNSPKYRSEERWDFVKGNETFFVHPLDGEIFAQVINLSTGYDVFLHGPLETPDFGTPHHSSDNGFYMKLYVTAITIYTSPEAAKLTVMQRKCRFQTESNLPHSPIYSYNLCRMECRISLSQKMCNCTPHFYRRKGLERVCNTSELRCLNMNKELMVTLYNKTSKKKVCECLPNCDDVNYIIQSMSLQSWFLGTNLQWGMVSYPKLRYRREIIFGFTDVLVSVGGMAGLFLGCSVLSFMEIAYFYTLRLFWYLRNYNSDQERIRRQNKLAVSSYQGY